jgi:hypothetical protein
MQPGDYTFLIALGMVFAFLGSYGYVFHFNYSIFLVDLFPFGEIMA